MLCTNCGKKQANTHIKRVINGHVQEFHLCSQCASQAGLESYKPYDLSDLWGSFFNMDMEVKSDSKRCESCDSTYSEIASKGKLGCPECYSTFYDQLIPSIRKIHGKSSHTGKVPGNLKDYDSLKKLKNFKKDLKAAIQNEEYENAAKLRDKIKLLEKEVKDNENK